MREKHCKVDSCSSVTRIVRDMCTKHYQRWLKHGDPHALRYRPGDVDVSINPTTGLLNRIESRLVWDGEGCWNWTGSGDEHGYGKFRHNGEAWSVHRYVYSVLVGPIPEGLHIDHLCFNTSCANPSHLEPVTPTENNRRRDVRRNQTHCVNGHELTPDNTRMLVGVNKGRRCRICLRETQRRYRAKKRPTTSARI